MIRIALVAMVILLGATWLRVEEAEENAPVNPPVFRVESNTVLAPTLVIKKSGEIVYGLKHDDFIVRVNGREQPFYLDESPDFEKISVIVAVQVGGNAYMLFENKRKESWESGSILDGLGTMVENFIGDMDAEVAVLSFDSHVTLVQDFTGDIPAAKEKLDNLKGSGNLGAAILDTVDFAFQLFKKTQPERRHVLLLISESRDSKSRTIKTEILAEKLAAGNIQIHILYFQTLRMEVTRDLKSNKPAQNDKIEVSPLWLASVVTKAFTKNTAYILAENTGGEHLLFSSRNSFDTAFINLANRFRNTYQLSGFGRRPRFS